eukprot:m.188741 g.188741  ORF g.188741 m.188741 type:complete len:684 (-) comp17538_c1_seq9:1843-3894(-)
MQRASWLGLACALIALLAALWFGGGLHLPLLLEHQLSPPVGRCGVVDEVVHAEGNLQGDAAASKVDVAATTAADDVPAAAAAVDPGSGQPVSEAGGTAQEGEASTAAGTEETGTEETGAETEGEAATESEEGEGSGESEEGSGEPEEGSGEEEEQFEEGEWETAYSDDSAELEEEEVDSRLLEEDERAQEYQRYARRRPSQHKHAHNEHDEQQQEQQQEEEQQQEQQQSGEDTSSDVSEEPLSPCNVRGAVEPMCCSAQTAQETNARIRPVLSELVQQLFFRLYRVDLDRGCPFWRDNSGMCMSRSCAVQECDASEVPAPLQGEDGEGERLNAISDGQCLQLNTINSSLTTAEQQRVQTMLRSPPLPAESNTTTTTTSTSKGSSAQFYSTLVNPEGYTGYGSERSHDSASHKIWRAIYEENCFPRAAPAQSYSSSGSGSVGLHGSEPCTEKRVFFRLVSGLHTSISTHLCAKWVDVRTGRSSFNVTDYRRRFDSAAGHEYLRNLYFTWSVVMRALMKIREPLCHMPFYTGDAAADARVRTLVARLLENACACPPTFDEAQLFNQPATASLKSEFLARLHNISRIMDCVGCDKCRFWGKLQVHGLVVAARILFEPESNTSLKGLNLSKNDVVALVNVLDRLSLSIDYTEQFRARWHETQSPSADQSFWPFSSSSSPEGSSFPFA